MTHDQCPECGDELDDPILDFAYDVPDCLFEIVKTRGVEGLRGRLWVSPGNDFLEFDRSRWFVRGLFPVQIEGGLEFRFGVWLELPSKAEFVHLMEAWDDKTAYEKLSFEARLANGLERQGVLGEYVHVEGGPDVNQKPVVHESENPTLKRLLKQGWTLEQYERFLDDFERRAAG
jgi:hypothetical protein